MGQVVSINAHKKKKRRNHNIRWTRIIFVCLLFALIGFGISQSPIFNVKSIDVSGNENLDTQTIIDLSGIDEGQHIYSFSAGRAETMISTNPLVESVIVKRDFPNKVIITITERQAVAAVAADDGVLIVDKDGYVLKKQKLFDGLEYMLITGVDDLFTSDDEKTEAEVTDDKTDNSSDEGEADTSAESDAVTDTEEKSEDPNDSSKENGEETAEDSNEEEEPVTIVTGENRTHIKPESYADIKNGTCLQSEKLATGLNVVLAMDEAAMNVVTEINVTDPQNIVMDTVYGIKIYFGDENDISEKFEICNSVLKEENEKGYLTKINYIDISVPAHPALKYNN